MNEEPLDLDENLQENDERLIGAIRDYALVKDTLRGIETMKRNLVPLIKRFLVLNQARFTAADPLRVTDDHGYTIEAYVWERTLPGSYDFSLMRKSDPDLFQKLQIYWTQGTTTVLELSRKEPV
jgi:hypothetical protein